MADDQTHKRVAAAHEGTMRRLLEPSITKGIYSEGDLPWIGIIAYHTIFHLIERIVATDNPDCHCDLHEKQIEFLAKNAKLQKLVFPYDMLNLFCRYALYRTRVNASSKTEEKIFSYGSKAMLVELFEPLKQALTEYRQNQLKLVSP